MAPLRAAIDLGVRPAPAAQGCPYRLARAVAVLGTATSLRDAAALAELDLGVRRRGLHERVGPFHDRTGGLARGRRARTGRADRAPAVEAARRGPTQQVDDRAVLPGLPGQGVRRDALRTPASASCRAAVECKRLRSAAGIAS
ncbi:hypothetical protein [Pseudonocardia dioxanivorans]|uniref:hypothetical protein n=1 Tax=Pseudonocardia dioxanivorans TaxID=240495 RepID=UPI0005A157B3|nr:hypothetical protein [Pseudonocardia dioxanivorans]